MISKKRCGHWPGRLAAGEDAGIDVGEASGNTASRLQAQVVAVAGAKEDLVFRVVLHEKAGQVLFQVGSSPCRAFMTLTGGGRNRARVWSGAAKVIDGQGNQQAVNSRGDDSEDGKRAQSERTMCRRSW